MSYGSLKVNGSSGSFLEVNKHEITKLGLKDLDTWKCYEIHGYRGAFVFFFYCERLHSHFATR